jgi:phosphoribosylformylglycinamidine synthase subunit PurL
MTTLDFLSMTKEQVIRTLAYHRVHLTADEIIKIQKELGRPLTHAECILWSIQGSEHCSYKSSRHHLATLPTDAPHVMLGPSEDAGIVEIARDNAGKKYGIVMSHESHNHPSQIVPVEGAATGVGGNVRDVSCMGARVIAIADPLRFGDIHSSSTSWIHDGVVSGIASYGNPIGVPTIAGDVYYDPSYNDNCLVNVVTLGVLREDEIIHSRAPKRADGYDLILVGKPTDNSGFGGASFASGSLGQGENQKGAVQEPNAFLKRHLLKATYALFDMLKKEGRLDAVGFKDLGAGGIACASVELADAAGYGAQIDLDSVVTDINDLDGAVILCAETQERYMWVSHPDVTPRIIKHYNDTFKLPDISAGACAAVIGSITKNPQYVVRYKKETLVDAPAPLVTRGLSYNRAYTKPQAVHAEPNVSRLRNLRRLFAPQVHDQPNGIHDLSPLSQLLLQVLSHPNVASRSSIYDRYDKQVQGQTCIEPGMADAGVLQPFIHEEYPSELAHIGIALSVDQNPRYCQIDPYWGAIAAVVEAARNVAAVGASPWALTDCLNFGNPEKPTHMWEFVESVRGIKDASQAIGTTAYPTAPLPIISGNVSFYNESAESRIAPSPIIACLGRLPDVRKAVSMSFQKWDSHIVLVGERKNECGGSVFYDLFHEKGAFIPKPDLKTIHKEIAAVVSSIEQGHILAAHDISDGGVAAALAEMCFGGLIGAHVRIESKLEPDRVCFSETGGFLLEVKRGKLMQVTKIFDAHATQLFVIGSTSMHPHIRIGEEIDVPIAIAKDAWQHGLAKHM